ncbi:GatB/YqeY domain-containing protein [Schizosaccharomyces cryophilus OY26]|uniref:Altered inheritance of mitochondria protein 41 n=1 Tax=Schizosaccharomyces cryophilus (strain OY26 / ATCC MYA-4695 / CBS 11777 / NBRC 106824 / NRRL Y48691) TaxID=653667 RepID=S9XAM5_SCHCR|nr:GatB/YqeY domain-containing protein [Schizosaccharomyces cryophilus OY26]EPY54202.1 GatB/YqeY domain-containing protein [Schizosaccharomyces cryophilus OY26]
MQSLLRTRLYSISFKYRSFATNNVMPALQSEIRKKLMESMRNKDKKQSSTIKLFLSEIEIANKSNRPVTNDSEVIRLLKKSIKKKKQAIEQFLSANRTDLSDKEKVEIEILQKFLPRDS